MSLKQRLARVVERLTNTHIFRMLPQGVNVFSDLQLHLPSYRCSLVLDVGANVGQSALQFRQNFPHSTIYCFEPVTENFQLLTANTRHLSNVLCSQVALGRSKGMGRMSAQRGTMSQLQVADTNGQLPTTTDVMVDTVDDYCAEKKIERIDYLKIDTEGHDLAVLEGAKSMLVNQQIGLIEVEVGMNPHNTRHVPFHQIQTFLEGHQYFLFGIYE